ncbi:MAG TPA: MAPEG family protein [Allosphingosinicella sp.]
MQTTLPITLTIAGACALINIWLGIRVSQLRFRHKVPLGDGGNPQVAARMRAHANLIEYTPFFLILLALIELSQGSKTWLWGVAIAYVLSRLAHAFGMDRKAPNKLRVIGMVITWAVLLGLAAYALALPYMHAARPAPASYQSHA